MNNEIIERLNSLFPGRNHQINSLVDFFKDDIEYTPTQKILLHGPPNTGKTAILLKLLELSNKSYTFVDCAECYLPKLLFHILLQELTENEEERDCETIMDFVNFFKQAPPVKKLDFMVLKNCHRISGSLLHTFFILPEYLSKYGWNFWLVFIDQNTSAYLPFMHDQIARVTFPRYSLEQLAEIIMILRPKHDKELFQQFLNYFLKCVYKLHRDVFEISHLADILYEKYKKPIEESKIQANDELALCRNITQYLKFESNNHIFNFSCSVITCGTKKDSEKLPVLIELPFKTKFLLIASYIASSVSPKYDKRLFCKNSSKQKKRNQIVNRNMPCNRLSTLIGPKQFTINRLLSIFSALSGERNQLTAILLQQVTFLVELKLLAFIGNDDGNLDNPRYKCIADHDTVIAVGESVNCDVERYLIA